MYIERYYLIPIIFVFKSLPLAPVFVNETTLQYNVISFLQLDNVINIINNKHYLLRFDLAIFLYLNIII